MMPRILFLIALGWNSLFTTVHADTYTYPQLVKRMTDMQELAKLPPAGEKTALASSYDRHKQYDAATDKYINWSANGDGSGILRMEGTDTVFMDVQGPGCIWRMWAATAGMGHVKIYLDGAATPVVDLPFQDYFNGQTAPFNRSNLVYTPSAKAPGVDNYTPIPFQKSCKIVGEKGFGGQQSWAHFYQVTYSQFPAGTVVPTFSMNLSAEDSAALDQADKILGQCGQNPTADTPETKTESPSVSVDPGKTATVADLDGSGAITALKVKLDLPKDAEAQRILLRQLTISMTWDDDAAPSVWSPLGDFFGYVGGADNYQSLPVGLLDDGTFYSYWYMPYGKKAHIEIGNDGPAPVSTSWQVSYAPLNQPIEKLARFHAKWHRDAFLPTRPDRSPDWTLLTTQGMGRYVGTHLHGWNPRGSWWGEGNDKFFIDGEKFPSILGTGSEDYFGFAWSSDGHFSRPYHNQILNETNQGHFDVNRWHISDSVPFDSSFEADIEKYFSNERSTLYAAEAFWYLNAGGTDPYTPVPVTDRVGYWIRPEIYHEPGAIEGEWLHPVVLINEVGVEDTYQHGKQWSSDEQLYWDASYTGETLELPIFAQKAGNYHLIVHLGKGPNYGTFQIVLNGVDLGQPIDLYDPEIKTTDAIDLGVVALTNDKPVLKMTVTEKNAASTGDRFGLDYLKLVPMR